MKIMHSGDLHYSPKLLEEVDHCFGFAVDHAVNEGGYDCAVITGDLFDHRIDLHHPTVGAILNQVKKLADNMPVLILSGTFSHDTPGSLDVFKTLSSKYPIHVSDRIEQVALISDDLGMRWFNSKNWIFDADVKNTKIIFSCLPPINKAAVAAISGAEEAAHEAVDYVSNILNGWSVYHQNARDSNIPCCILTHGTVSGCKNETGITMAGLDYELTTGSLFAAQSSAVLMSHIHQHQKWQQEGRTIAYSGNIGRFHFGEVQDKGFCCWEVSANTSDCKLIVTPAKSLLQIDYDGIPDMEELAELSKNSKNAYVRVRYQVDEEHKNSVNKKSIESMFIEAGAKECKVQGHINPVQRVRAQGINKSPSLSDRLTMWTKTTDFEGDDKELAQRLNTLQSHNVQQIVNSICAN